MDKDKVDKSKLILGHVDGDLSPQEAGEFEELMAIDPDINNLFRSYKELETLLSSLPIESPSMRFSKSVAEKAVVIQDQRWQPVEVFPRLYILWITTIAAVGSTLLYLGFGSRESTIDLPIINILSSKISVIFSTPAFSTFSMVIVAGLILLVMNWLLNKRKWVRNTHVFSF